MTWEIRVGDALEELRKIDDGAFDCCVTSPPYWGLRDYNVRGQLGLEETPEAWVEAMLSVFREVRRVLKPKGTLWLNLGDCYATNPPGRSGPDHSGLHSAKRRKAVRDAKSKHVRAARRYSHLKIKDLVGAPWMLAFALRADGWHLRCDIVWSKPNPMPESVSDRPTRAHEYVFLLSRQRYYYYDAQEGSEPTSGTAHSRGAGTNPKANIPRGWDSGPGGHRARVGNYKPAPPSPRGDISHRLRNGLNGRREIREKQNPSWSAAVRGTVDRRNWRSVWEIPTQPFAGAHFATFPEELARRCVLAGCPKDGVVLDPFAGSGTTGAVAVARGRSFVGIELNPQYAEMARARVAAAKLEYEGGPMFAGLNGHAGSS